MRRGITFAITSVMLFITVNSVAATKSSPNVGKTMLGTNQMDCGPKLENIVANVRQRAIELAQSTVSPEVKTFLQHTYEQVQANTNPEIEQCNKRPDATKDAYAYIPDKSGHDYQSGLCFVQATKMAIDNPDIAVSDLESMCKAIRPAPKGFRKQSRIIVLYVKSAIVLIPMPYSVIALPASQGLLWVLSPPKSIEPIAELPNWDKYGGRPKLKSRNQIED